MNKIIKLDNNTVLTITSEDVIIKQYNEFDNTNNIIVLSKVDLNKIKELIK